jgi:hypothetical protein
MKKKSLIILLIFISIGFIFAIGIEKYHIEEKINIDINNDVDELLKGEDKSEVNNNIKDESEENYNNEGYEILSFNELSETEKFLNIGYIISMKVYLRVNQILNIENIDELNKTEKEIMVFEDEFNTLDSTEDTSFAETILRELFSYAYEAIDLYARRLSGEEIKSIMIYDKISKTQEKYFAYAKEFDNKKTPMSREIIEEAIEIKEEINQKLKNIENHE